MGIERTFVFESTVLFTLDGESHKTFEVTLDIWANREESGREIESIVCRETGEEFSLDYFLTVDRKVLEEAADRICETAAWDAHQAAIEEGGDAAYEAWRDEQ